MHFVLYALRTCLTSMRDRNLQFRSAVSTGCFEFSPVDFPLPPAFLYNLARKGNPPKIWKRVAKIPDWKNCAQSFSGLQKGPAERGHVKKRQKSSKSVKKFFDTFRQFSRRAKNVKNRQKVSKGFSTIFAQHLFSGPFCNPLNLVTSLAVMVFSVPIFTNLLVLLHAF